MKTAAKFTPEVKRQIALEAKYELARRHYIDYVDLVHHGKWKRAKHLQLVCNKLEEVLSASVISNPSPSASSGVFVSNLIGISNM